MQRKWQALESIFVGSADIRVQLPEDSKRFDAANADYVVGWGAGGWRSGGWQRQPAGRFAELEQGLQGQLLPKPPARLNPYPFPPHCLCRCRRT